MASTEERKEKSLLIRESDLITETQMVGSRGRGVEMGKVC